ncbi:amidohydrolase [Ornithinibacillus sp. BX22]|uniref:Amidohydrolase n=1 Tax=Ornithinibacillus hominis TaxID=2763055 RepID=A0A923L3A0_9BACI|nr:amidohydrolase [Ornithinibacillus hominis]MBC5635683.1 amidohydrolase [Ornithinibacillus hominis]
MDATLIIKNANVLTLDSNNRVAGSVAISEGKIVGIWDTPEPSKGDIKINERTTVIDLKGDTLIPGFIDTHNHILMYALMRSQVNCSTPPNHSIYDILNKIEKAAADTINGEWIQGYGFDDTMISEKRHILRHELDRVAPDNPVIITHISGHLAYVNSLALRLASIAEDVEDPSGGHYGRYENGLVNGVLYENGAMDPITSILPKKSVTESLDHLKHAAKEYLSQGITTNTDAMVSNVEDLNVHLLAAKTGENPMRTRLMIMHTLLREGAPFEGYSPEQLNNELMAKSNGLVKLDSIKMFQDGSIQGLTGALRKPYHNNKALLGNLIHPQEDFQEEIIQLHQKGFRIAIHGNGDRAIESILQAYENAISKFPRKRHQHRIEHVQTATLDDLEKMSSLEVAGSFFINHVYYWGDRHEELFLGPERARRISPLADAIRNNLLFTLHSDCPITPISPLFSVWAAVNRLTSSNRVLGPNQQIDIITALKSMTIYGAILNFDEENTGSIEVGKLADFAVLDADPLSIDKEAIKDINVKATFLNGNLVYGESQID